MWQAHYNDRTELAQFSEGKEQLFRDIDQNKLVKFTVRVNSKTYEVDLVNGTFNIAGVPLSFENFGLSNDFSLIYFKRVKRHIGSMGNVIETLYCVGWKTQIDSHVFKRILKITEGGDVILALR